MPGMSEQDEQISAEVIAELRQIQQRYDAPARKGATHRSEDVRAQAKVWARKAQRFGQLADRAERVWLNADNVASIKAGAITEVEV